MKKAFLGVALALASTTAAYAAKAPQLTPMQMQAIQQKEFEADKATVFSSVVDVFQDLGYTINSADLNTGFITAESATTNKTSFWDALAEASANGNTRATAFVEARPSGMTRVRLNFVSTKQTSMRYGQGFRQDKPILDASVYQRAFEKIDEALFVRNATDAPVPAPAPREESPEPQESAAPAQIPAKTGVLSPAVPQSERTMKVIEPSSSAKTSN